MEGRCLVHVHSLHIMSDASFLNNAGGCLLTHPTHCDPNIVRISSYSPVPQESVLHSSPVWRSHDRNVSLSIDLPSGPLLFSSLFMVAVIALVIVFASFRLQIRQVCANTLHRCGPRPYLTD